jgi:hypothetical protein
MAEEERRQTPGLPRQPAGEAGERAGDGTGCLYAPWHLPRKQLSSFPVPLLPRGASGNGFSAGWRLFVAERPNRGSEEKSKGSDFSNLVDTSTWHDSCLVKRCWGVCEDGPARKMA